jgi:hypothetical protein
VGDALSLLRSALIYRREDCLRSPPTHGYGGGGGGGYQEVHEPGMRRAGVGAGGGRGLEEGLAAAVRMLRPTLRQVRVRTALLLRRRLPSSAVRDSPMGNLDWMHQLEKKLVHAVRVLLTSHSSPFAFRCFATLFVPFHPPFCSFLDIRV